MKTKVKRTSPFPPKSLSFEDVHSVGIRLFEAFESKGAFSFAAFSGNFIHHSNGLVAAIPGDSPDIYRRLYGVNDAEA